MLSPFVGYNLVWLAGSQKTKGKVQGIGHRTGIDFGPSSYVLVSFAAGRDTAWFQGMDQGYEEGDSVVLRYKVAKPEDARINTVLSIWGDTLAYGGVAFIFWAVVFFSDLVPKRARFRIGGKPFIKMHP